jgi:peptidoglycan/LPS O-acetylase OafA/YrhL
MLILNFSPSRSRSRLLLSFARFPSRFRREVSGGVYRPEIDGLRFFAIAIVVLGHLFQRGVRFFPSFQAVADGGAIGGIFHLGPGLGVYLFFAVSGFIIASQARKAKTSPLSAAFLKSYFGRRVLRIEPPYVILLIVSWLLLNVTGYQPERTQQFFAEPHSLNLSLLGGLFYAHDLVWGTFPRLFPPGWSLEVEVQFYIMAPTLFWIWFRLGHMRTRILLAAGVLLAGSLLAIFVPRQIGPFFTYYSILSYFPLFWLGILLADLRTWLTESVVGLSPALLTAIGWLGLLDFVCLPEAPDTLIPGLMFWGAAIAAIAAMFISAFAPQSGFRRFCALPWISLIGGACYSIYLVHLQVLQFLSTLAAKLAPGLSFDGVLALMVLLVGVVLVVGLTFYVFIERTFMMPRWHIAFLRRLRLFGPAPRTVPAAVEMKPTRTV